MPRRPLLFMALTFTVGIGIPHFLDVIGIVIVLLGGGILLFNVCRQKAKEKKYLILLFLILMIGIIFTSLDHAKTSYIISQEGEEISGEAVVRQAIKKDSEYYKLVVDVTLMGKTPMRERAILQYYGPLEDSSPVSDLVGRRVAFYGEVTQPSSARNPKTFDYRAYLRTMDIFTAIVCREGSLEASPDVYGISNHVVHFLSQVKGKISDRLTSVIGEEKSSMAAGMLWGEKEGIQEEDLVEFRMNGTAHILAVSGIHVALVYVFLNKLFLSRKSGWVDLCVVLLLICYAAMASFSPSVLRAVLMIAFHILSKNLYRRYDILSCGSATLILLLMLNPGSLFHLGFQLSFLAIFSIGTLIPFFEKIHKSFITPILGIQLGVSPLTAYYFNYFSIAAFVANIPVVFLAGMIIPIGILLIPFALLDYYGVVFEVLATMMGLLIEGMTAVNSLFYSPGKSYAYVTSPGEGILFMYYFLIFFLSSELGRIYFIRKKYGKILKITGVAIACAVLVQACSTNDFQKAELVFVDVGQGDCLHLRTQEGLNVLVDGGGSPNFNVGEKILLPYLLKNGVNKIDAAFVTHLHEDHFSGIAYLAKIGFIRHLYTYEGNQALEGEILSLTGLQKNQLSYVGKGDTVRIGNELRIEVLSPDKHSKEDYQEMQNQDTDENESSLVLKIWHGSVSCLMTGDIDEKGEEKVMDRNPSPNSLEADILKVAHHGSRFSTSENFLKRVSPSVSVIQVGKNTFGHPTGQVLEKLEQRHIPILRNDLQGAIGIDIPKQRDGKMGMRLFTMIPMDEVEK